MNKEDFDPVRHEKEAEINALRSQINGATNDALAAADGFVSFRDDAEKRLQRQALRHRLRELELEGELEAMRADKFTEIGIATQTIIHNGVEVGGKNYSLTEHDQIELKAQLAAILAGATHVPYHADGELCRMFTAVEFMAVADAAMAHVFKKRTYCNHVNTWISRAKSVEELDEITFGVDLPEDLALHMKELILAAGGEQNG